MKAPDHDPYFLERPCVPYLFAQIDTVYEIIKARMNDASYNLPITFQDDNVSFIILRTSGGLYELQYVNNYGNFKYKVDREGSLQYASERDSGYCDNPHIRKDVSYIMKAIYCEFMQNPIYAEYIRTNKPDLTPSIQQHVSQNYGLALRLHGEA